MSEKNLNQRLAIIGLVILAAVFVLFRYDESGIHLNLNPGLDIAGGVAMIFEIQEQPGEDNRRIAEQMVQLLKKRVDPSGVYDLDWRVIGANRIEVQMPLPPPENKQLREAYRASEDALFDSNITPGEMEKMFRLPPDQRPQRIAELAGGNAERQKLLEVAAAKWDAYKKLLDAKPSDEAAQHDYAVRLRAALEELEDAKDAILRTNIQPATFQNVRDMPPKSKTRAASIAALKEKHRELADKIDAAIKAYDAWRGKRAFLEGPADLRRLLRGAGVLEFRILAKPSPDNATKYDRLRKQLEERGPQPEPGATVRWFKIDNPMAFFGVQSPQELARLTPADIERREIVAGKRGDDWYVLASTKPEDCMLVEHGPNARKWKLKSAVPSRDEHGRQSVAFTLDPVGGSMFAKLTGNHIKDQLCIFIDDVAYSHAVIQSKISTRGQITGDFSREKILYLVQTMQAGVLPARLNDTPLSEITIGSSLGDSNLHHALRAGIAGVIAVAIVMIVYYFVCGAIANVALLLNVLLVLAAMAMLGARITLAGIAGIILTIGMTVDANVLIYERMREEKQRGSSLRMIIKNGYEKAFSTIIDANITTLLTCIIIYKVGSEEIKGFGLTLGWGIVTSLFTALFVTRTLFLLLIKLKWLKDIRMLKLIGVPKVDWYGKRWVFGTISCTIIALGLFSLYERGNDALDVEFLGGSNVEVALKPGTQNKYNDLVIAERLRQVGEEVAKRGQKLAEARVTQSSSDATALRVVADDIPATELAAMIAEPLESANLVEREGVDATRDPKAVILRPAEGATAEKIQAVVRGLASKTNGVPLAGNNIARANVGMVIETDNPEDKGRFWNLTTTTTNTQLVRYALTRAFGDDLERQPRVTYTFEGRNDLPYPITARRLEVVVPNLPETATADLADYIGGAAMRFRNLDPPQTIEAVKTRLRNMRLQPDYADLPWRRFDVIGIHAVSPGIYNDVVIVVADETIRYGDNPDAWAETLARPELDVAMATFDTEQTLRKVTQFKPQIAAQSQTQAMLALLLSWMMIIAYLWIRFGRPMYGIAGVIALIHDVLIALSFIGFAGFVGGTAIGNTLLVSAFKIDMTVIAAFLTIIGYSINDTIVVFDRIRETRGRLGTVTPDVINRSINETLSRTIMTSLTTLIVLLTMYIFGGDSIRGFNYCMILGVVTGTYSSIAIASPLLLLHARVAKFETARRAAPSAG